MPDVSCRSRTIYIYFKPEHDQEKDQIPCQKNLSKQKGCHGLLPGICTVKPGCCKADNQKQKTEQNYGHGISKKIDIAFTGDHLR